MDQGSFITPKGHLSYRANQQIFHSLYDPYKEISNFINIQNIGPGDHTFLLLGETLGYLSTKLREQFPDSLIIKVYPTKTLYGPAEKKCYSWSLDETYDFKELLQTLLTEDNFSNWKLIVWPPFQRAFPAEVKALESEFITQFRMVQGSYLTQMFFGRRWFLNTLKNLKYIQSFTLPDFRSLTIVIAASGPSLGDFRKVLTEYRDQFFLLALPSSLRALKEWNISPDGVIVTDGGFWSRYHLRSAPRNTWVIQSLSGVFAPEIESPRVFFSQGLYCENLFENKLAVIPSQGTVAVTALNWALKATKGKVFIAGLDLCYRDFEAHVQPHTFSPWENPVYTRLSPLETLLQKSQWDSNLKPLSARYSITSSLETYGKYFKNYTPMRKVYRIDPSILDFPGFQNCTQKEFLALLPLEKIPLPKLENGPDFTQQINTWIQESKILFDSGDENILTENFLNLIKFINPKVFKEAQVNSNPGTFLRQTIDDLKSIIGNISYE